MHYKSNKTIIRLSLFFFDIPTFFSRFKLNYETSEVLILCHGSSYTQSFPFIFRRMIQNEQDCSNYTNMN